MKNDPDSFLAQRAIISLIDQVYGLGPWKTKTPPEADIIIARFKAATPDRRNLMCKALRGMPDIPRFEIGGVLRKASAGDSPARPIVEAVLSTSLVDLDGDRMSENALRQMAAGFKGLTIFLNHRYSWPEDVFGSCGGTSLTKNQATSVLTGTIAVETANPRALQSYAMMKNGTRAGVSVGVIVLSHHLENAAKPGGPQVFVIDDVLPLEASVCGIPSNPGSWVSQAKSAVKSASQRR